MLTREVRLSMYEAFREKNFYSFMLLTDIV